jgi:DNA polymerase III alpha subunit
MLNLVNEHLKLVSWVSFQQRAQYIDDKNHDLCHYFVRPCPQSLIYQHRLREELDLINKHYFSKIFIIVASLIRQLKCLYICRGSAASSLVCYLLGITHIDPIENGMNFARFINPKRLTSPDIDIDFPQHLRDDIFETLYDMYPFRVGRVINHVYFKAKSSYNEALRRCRGVHSSTTLNIASKLIHTHHYDSLHCGGAVVFDQHVPKDLIAKQKLSKRDCKPTHPKLNVDKREAESKGLIKIDLLSNRGLSILNALDPTKHIDQYPSCDPKIVELLHNLDVLGVTFIETPNMIRVMSFIKPCSPVELSLCLALARPAPNKVKAKQKLQQGKQANPDLTKLNFFVYDDDVIEQIAQWLDTDFTDAESIRKGLAKGSGQAWASFRNCLSKKFKPKEVQAIIDDCQFVQRYSFCKSHSLNYAYLCWALLWHKAHNNAEFWRAVLNHAQSLYQDWVYFREIIRAGYKVELVDRLRTRSKRVLSKSVWKYKNGYYYLSDTPKQQSMLTNWFKSQQSPAEELSNDIIKVQQIRDFGYWTGSWIQQCKIVDDWCCGLIATSRDYKCFNETMITFCYVMVGEGQYIHLTISGELPKNALLIEADITLDLSDRVDLHSQKVYSSSRWSCL